MHDMALALRIAVDALSGFLVIGLGAFMLSVRPRTSATLAFAAFAFAFGGYFAIVNSFGLVHATIPVALLRVARLAWTIIATSIVVLMVTFPHRLGASDRRLFILPGVLAAVLVAGAAQAFAARGVDENSIYGFTGNVADTAVLSYVALLALRLRREQEHEAQAQIGLTATGFALYYVYFPAFGLIRALGTPDAALPTFFVLARFAATLLVGLLFLYATVGPAPRIARNTSLVLIAVATTGAMMAAFAPEWSVAGPVRIVMVLLIGYAIVRYRLLGIDVKLRFAISKSTIAAVFIAIFFIASEAAQQFFGDRFESGYLGILAAGALVFAIAPLSRVADRLAEKAVPLAGPVVAVVAAGSAGKEEAYRAALRVALRDKRLSRDEEIGLAHLSDELGLTHKRARELWHEVEASIAARRKR